MPLPRRKTRTWRLCRGPSNDNRGEYDPPVKTLPAIRLIPKQVAATFREYRVDQPSPLFCAKPLLFPRNLSEILPHKGFKEVVIRATLISKRGPHKQNPGVVPVQLATRHGCFVGGSMKGPHCLHVVAQDTILWYARAQVPP